MEKVLMKCGHTANAETYDGRPYCIICGCEEIMPKPDLTKRKARCSFCGKEVDSDYNLPFFEYRKDKETDSYYCGCGGWD